MDTADICRVSTATLVTCYFPLFFCEKEKIVDNRRNLIHLYINSPGGVVTAGLAIYDTMQYIRPDVSTICIGSCASMAAVLLTSGAPGKRFALLHSNVMIHQPLGGVQGQATEIEIHAREILRLRDELNGILSKHSGQPIETIRRDTERDNFMTAEMAQKYGLIDRVLTRNELDELTKK